MPPEPPARRTHPDSGNGGSGDGGGKKGVDGGSSTGRDRIMTYDADGDCRRRRCPRGALMADVMMTMVGEWGGKAKARQRQGNGNRYGAILGGALCYINDPTLRLKNRRVFTFGALRAS